MQNWKGLATHFLLNTKKINTLCKKYKCKVFRKTQTEKYEERTEIKDKEKMLNCRKRTKRKKIHARKKNGDKGSRRK